MNPKCLRCGQDGHFAQECKLPVLPDDRVLAVPLLTEREIVKCLTASGCVGTVKMSYDSGPYEITRTSVNADRFARAIESLVRSKLGAGVPLTDDQWQRIADITESFLTRDMKDEIEAVIGIVGKEGGNV